MNSLMHLNILQNPFHPCFLFILNVVPVPESNILIRPTHVQF